MQQDVRLPHSCGYMYQLVWTVANILDHYYTCIATAAYVEFTAPMVTLLENSGFSSIALQRRGYLQASTSVKCMMRNNTATGGSTHEENITDFFIAPIAETVTFDAGQTHKGTCNN